MTADKPTTSGARVLIVDDEPDIAALVAYHVARAGYRVSTAATGPDALRAAREERPDLVVLDVMLPGMSGYEVLEALRRDAATAGVAVLMLTAHKEEEDRIRGLSIGADDYVTKPFSPPELVLRIGAILRRGRTGPSPGELIVVGPLEINRGTHEVAVNGAAVDLTPTEYRLLVTLAERRGRVQPRGQLLELVWDASPDVQTRTVDVHVQRLRAKLGAAGDFIETVRGFGYRMLTARGDEGGDPGAADSP